MAQFAGGEGRGGRIERRGSGRGNGRHVIASNSGEQRDRSRLGGVPHTRTHTHGASQSDDPNPQCAHTHGGAQHARAHREIDREEADEEARPIEAQLVAPLPRKEARKEAGEEEGRTRTRHGNTHQIGLKESGETCQRPTLHRPRTPAATALSRTLSLEHSHEHLVEHRISPAYLPHHELVPELLGRAVQLPPAGELAGEVVVRLRGVLVEVPAQGTPRCAVRGCAGVPTWRARGASAWRSVARA